MSTREGHSFATDTAPIVLFIFRRPETTSRVFEEIRKAKPKKLYIVSDAARAGNKEEQELVSKTRSVVDKIDWTCQVSKIYATENMGLRERILTGLDAVFDIEQEAIIIEDDCLPSASFFGFCSELLQRYINNKDIALVSGSNFAPTSESKEDYFFSHSMYIWGWATWARTWREFRAAPQVEKWTSEEKQFISGSFASKSQKRAFFSLMDDAKDLNTWDVSLAVWMRQFRKISIIPRLNLVENIGFGEEATHTKFEAFDVQISRSDFHDQLLHPDKVLVLPSLERRMWRIKSFRWLTFPMSHPLDFVGRVYRYLLTTRGVKTEKTQK